MKDHIKTLLKKKDYQKISNLSNEEFYLIDLNSKYIYPLFCAKTFCVDDRISFEELLESGIIHKNDVQILKNNILNPLKANKFEIRMLFGSECKYYEFSYEKDLDVPFELICKLKNVSEERRLSYESKIDRQTGCYNKFVGQTIITEKLNENKGGLKAFFIIDIDDFKSINDSLGHYVGDEVLKDVSSGLREMFRATDVIVRMGGDEFVVFMDSVYDLSVVESKAKSLLKVFDKQYSNEHRVCSISGSIGIAISPKDGSAFEELFKKADKALYQSKIKGKNQYCLYSNELEVGTMRSVSKIDNATRAVGAYFDYDFISEIFILLYEKESDDISINEALKLICLKYNADRSYIFESHSDPIHYDNTYEWCNEGINSEIDNLQNIPGELMFEVTHKSHNDIFYSNDLAESLKNDTAFEIMNSQGILSFVHAQVRKNDIVTFFLGLDDCTKTRVWTEKEINTLKYLSKLLSIMIKGKNLKK